MGGFTYFDSGSFSIAKKETGITFTGDKTLEVEQRNEREVEGDWLLWLQQGL